MSHEGNDRIIDSMRDELPPNEEPRWATIEEHCCYCNLAEWACPKHSDYKEEEIAWWWDEIKQAENSLKENQR